MIFVNFIRNVGFHGYKFSSFSRGSRKFQKLCYSTNIKMVRPSFNIDSYDCVGFDLDNTLCEYKLDALVPMEYNAMAYYLLSKGYSKEIMGAPIEAKELDFMQRGLLLDFERGNILKINNLGEILRANHGTRALTDGEISSIYGESRKSKLTIDFCNDLTCAWEPSMLPSFRALLDFFDMPASLAFARAIDDMDKRGNTNYIECGNDILSALKQCYSRENFLTEQGGFYNHLKNEPELYIEKCTDMVINWIKELNKSKIVFLITGSNVDLASFIASQCLGKNWSNLFDVVICYARKPGFFKFDRPFYSTKDLKEVEEISRPEMGTILSQGNWNQLYTLLAKSVGKPNPSCLYFGDNLVEDIYTPAKWACCDTAAIVQDAYKCSNRWGPFADSDTLWGNVLQTYALSYVPSLKNLAAHPLQEGVPFLIEEVNEKLEDRKIAQEDEKK